MEIINRLPVELQTHVLKMSPTPVDFVRATNINKYFYQMLTRAEIDKHLNSKMIQKIKADGNKVFHKLVDCKHGSYKEYSEGVLVIEAMYKYGKLHGEYRQYRHDGGVKKINHYMDGKLHGKQLVNYKNGQVKRQETYWYGAPHGEWQTWTEEGVLVEKCNYSHGLLDGLVEEWTSEGIPVSAINWCNGVEHGECKKYHANGELFVHCWNNEGLLDGLYQQWYDNKAQHSRCTYTSGVLNGKYKHWYKDGTLAVKTIYSGESKSMRRWKKSGKEIKESTLQEECSLM